LLNLLAVQKNAETAATTEPRTLTIPENFAIQAENLVRRFGKVEALAGVSLDIRPGEFFSLLGPSGCGKTTLLRIIAGLDFPDGGSLKIGGKNAVDIPAHRRPVNTVFQSYALFPHLSVWDNVAFGLRMKKIPDAEIRDRVERIMALVQIPDLAERRPAQLSGGQKQRAALARALVNEPQVLLLDEPLGALDLKLRKELQVELSRLQRRLGITFILVTHDQEEALVMSDRIAVMNAGKIEQAGGAKELYEHPRTRFAAQFLGSCNLLEGKISWEPDAGIASVAAAIGELKFKIPPSHRKISKGQPVTLGIRPEKISVLPISAAPLENQFAACVQDVVYGGAETQYNLRIGEQQIKACVLNARGSHTGFSAGQAVIIQLPADAMILLDD
jgi:spermidine/putrescine transport system ATP-binding protein